ncbi:MAG: capsule assembly Wzi family protein [Gammaproteobacteria bacterium]|nr:capsule assembly Wzi family protein [Gammaproteobacteria bacterium]MBU2677223.1 capsule assembly Wzi family protein [Gammaproteobacteria bacterium]NNL50954.1 capsule assembly Wzi family protein [Woeseiaceae bacterium]
MTRHLVGSGTAGHNPRMKSLLRICFLLLFGGSAISVTWAGPYIPAGDLVLRHDIQRLADHGIIKGPTSTWPLAWGPILDDLGEASATSLSPGVADALARVQQRASWETRAQELTFNARVGAADNATRIRSFQNTPRGKVEVGAGAGWLDDWFNVELNLQGVDSDQDTEEIRADDSMIGVVLGNWSIAASTQQRWWGPGWDGSIILSNNARPIPSLVVDRVFTDAFETKWLSWLGPWDLNVMFGQLEKERAIPDAQFFGMRFNFRPIASLEIGLSRTAQWCGDGRPCDASTFVDLFFGRDNIGDAGVGTANEPGNQMAGIDIRWSPSFIAAPIAAYGQFIGEDEAGGFPSRYLVQAGLEGAGYLMDRWSYRWFVELAGTSCDFVKSAILYNCAYTQSIYETGYRYRGRAIGHGADNDARLVSAGWIMVDANDSRWRVLLRSGDLNRGGAPDSRHSLTPTPQDVNSLDLSHSRVFSFGVIDIGAGYEQVDDGASGVSQSDGRFYMQWRSSY